MVVSVNELLQVHFFSRPKEEQVKIITEGKPRPLLNVPPLNVHIVGLTGVFENFDCAIYDKTTWLTGCDKRNALFCWICVMFNLEANEWNKSGFRDFIVLDVVLHSHQTSLNHLNAMLQYSLFLKECPSSASSPLDAVQRNINVKRNNEVLNRIIDAICLIATQVPPPRLKNNRCDLLNPKECIKLLNLIKNYDDSDVVDKAIGIVKNCPKIITDIVTELASLVRQTINNESKLSTFVSLIISEHRDFITKSKLSTVVRYVINGKVSESFLGFTNLDVKPTDVTIKKHTREVFSELGLSDRFPAVSIDGGVLSAKYLDNFLFWLHEQHPHTLFVPCHFHDFCYALQRTLSDFPLCAIFFKNLTLLNSYFQSNAKMCDVFFNFTGGEVPDLSNLKLTDSQFLRVLKMNRRHFVRFFTSIAEGTEEWSDDEIVKAISFQMILEEYQTIFLLETFYQLFEHTAILSELLSSHHPEGVFDSEVMKRVIQDINDDQEITFKQLWALTTAEIIADAKLNLAKVPGKEKAQELYGLFITITDCLTKAIRMRFEHAVTLKFIDIFDCENHDTLIIYDHQLKSLSDCWQVYFNMPRLEAERRMLVRHGELLGKKSVFDVLEFLWRQNLHTTFRNAYKLAEFIVTLPCKPICAANGSSKFDSIKAWASLSETPETDCLALLSIEYDVLEYLKSKINFYDEIISKLNVTLQDAYSNGSELQT